MASVSIVVSAYNEEAKIGDCLKSVTFADEIIVVDNESTDKTVEIAKKYKAKVTSKPNNKMLNINKNAGIAKAASDWILYLDADERVTKELQNEIKAILNQDSPDVAGYFIPRKNIIFGRWIEYAGMYPDYQMRLFKRGKGKYPEIHVHEMIDVDGKVAYLQSSLGTPQL